MENLKFVGATLLNETALNKYISDDIATKVMKREYNWWTGDAVNDGYALCVLSDGTIKSATASRDDIAIVPTLDIETLDGTDFVIGDVFTVLNLPFLIISERFAICLDNIGFAPFVNLEINKENRRDGFRFIWPLLADWFSYYIKDMSVRKNDIQSITLLSDEEYEANKDIIPLIEECWWLRTPGNESNYISYVDSYGSVFNNAIINCHYLGVRPVLIMNNVESKFTRGCRFMLDNYSWTVIKVCDNGTEYALCDEFLGNYQFDSDSNNFRTSEIKKKLDIYLSELKERLLWRA